MKLRDCIQQISDIQAGSMILPVLGTWVSDCGLPASIKGFQNEGVENACLAIFNGMPDDYDAEKHESGLHLTHQGRGWLNIDQPEKVYAFLSYLFEEFGEVIVDSFFFHHFDPAFRQLRTAYDYFLTQEGRVAAGLNRSSYIKRLAKEGVSHIEVNGLAFPMGLENGPKGETYPMFYTYCPALDQFTYSTLNKGLYPSYYLSANLNYLKENARMARQYGLIPGMMSFEPRSVPETFFSRYPMLRGARVDHPFRSFKPRYNMTITHPRVLEHYREMLQNIMREIPDLGFLTIWTNDSGAGFEHTKSLYVGRNGGAYLVREWKDDDEIARLAGNNALNFLRNLLDAGREINPDFRVITRMESFYGEHETIWKGLGQGLDVEAASLVTKGWEMPYMHPVFPDSDLLNGGGVHQQDFDAIETEKIKENQDKDARSAFYFGMGPELMFAPLMGINYPSLVWKRVQTLSQGEVNDLVVYGGSFPPEQVPFFANYAVLRHFQFNANSNIDEFLSSLALRWAGLDNQINLLQAWNAIEKAVLAFPNVSPLYNTIGFAWYRLWARPLVPDIEAIPEVDRAYYEDMMCTTPHNPNNVDLSKDVLFDISPVDHCARAWPFIDHEVLPQLDKAIDHLTVGIHSDSGRHGIMYDQLIRTKALRCWIVTQRNVAVWISSVYGYLKSQKGSAQQYHQDQLQEMINLEIDNMNELSQLLASDVTFLATMETGESPLMYGSNLTLHLEKKIRLMKQYRNHKPHIDPDYMMRQAGKMI